jgi:superfamily II DNA or RNA helicase
LLGIVNSGLQGERLITLRPYQADGERQIREAFLAGFKAPLYVMPTGAGKTVLFSSIAHSAERRAKRVLILAHRIELIDQIVEALKSFDVIPDIIAAGYSRLRGHATRARHTVAVASVQTLVRRLDSYVAPNLIIVDEAHHVTSGGTWAKILGHYASAKRLGVTATPCRLDGRGLGGHFDKMIIGPSVRQLTEMGYLAPARIFAPPTVDTSGLHIRAGDYKHEETEALMDVPSITGDALSHYQKHASDKPALVFCTSVAHAHNVAKQFRDGGVPAVALDGGTDRMVRRLTVQEFREGKIRVLASCDLFSEGFDVPGVHCGIFLRPTASMGLWLQQVGRILRPAEGKTHAICLDHAGNTQKHGLPSDDREWSLAADASRRSKKSAPSIRVCPHCFAASPARSIWCVECKREFEVKPRQDIEEREGELVELTPEQIQKKRERMMQGRSRSLEQLRDFAKRKGYAPGWADHIWQARQTKLQRKIA